MIENLYDGNQQFKRGTWISTFAFGVRNRAVANGNSTGFVVRRCCQCGCGKGRRPRACPNPPPDTAPRRGIPGANTSALTGRGAVPLSDEWGAYGIGHSSALAVVLPFGELIEDIVDPVIPAPLLPRFWIHVAHGAPNAQVPLADDQARGPARSRRSRNTSAQLAVDSLVVGFAWVSSPVRKHR